MLALLLLFVEMAKVVRQGRRSVVDHGLAFIVFGGMLAEFVLVSQAASAVFFLLVVMSFFDVLGGFAMRVRYAQREPVIEHVEPAPAPAVVEPAPAAPALDPAPKPVEPTAEHTAS